MPRRQLDDSQQHHLPPGVKWSTARGCRHTPVETEPRPDEKFNHPDNQAHLRQFQQRCACGGKVMGLRCPDCDTVY